MYKGQETPGGMPRILDDDLFNKVQDILNKNKKAPARTHGEGEYLLTTKLFCGHCKNMMVGYSGTSKTGKQYHHQSQKSFQLMIWNQSVQRIAGKHRKGHIDCGHKKSTDHIGNEKADMRFVIREENLERMLCVIHVGSLTEKRKYDE